MPEDRNPTPRPREYVIYVFQQVGDPKTLIITDPHRTVLPLQCDLCGEKPEYVTRFLQQCMFKLGCSCGRYLLLAVDRRDTPLINGTVRSFLASEWNANLDPIGHADDFGIAGATWREYVPPVPESVKEEIDRLTHPESADTLEAPAAPAIESPAIEKPPIEGAQSEDPEK